MVPNKKVLMIDDEPEFIDAVRARLEATGYTVVEAHDGDDGFAKARKERPALILVDLVMPRSNGFEALSRLKADPAISHIPVIVISAKSDADLVCDAGRMGASDYIIKPVVISDLVDRIKNFC